MSLESQGYLRLPHGILCQNPKLLRILGKAMISPLFPTCYPITDSQTSSHRKEDTKYVQPLSWVSRSQPGREGVQSNSQKEGQCMQRPQWSSRELLGLQHDRSVVRGLRVHYHSFRREQTHSERRCPPPLWSRNRSFHAWTGEVTSDCPL